MEDALNNSGRWMLRVMGVRVKKPWSCWKMEVAAVEEILI